MFELTLPAKLLRSGTMCYKRWNGTIPQTLLKNVKVGRNLKWFLKTDSGEMTEINRTDHVLMRFETIEQLEAFVVEKL